jgi:co-chaperonin GroES (HSP10)
MIQIKGPRVLVRQDKLEDKDPVFASAKKAGIEIAEHSREKRLEQNAVDEGVVVDIGTNCWQPPVGDGTPWCQVGDRVIFAKYGGSIRHEDDDYYIILNDEDIIGILSNE